MSTDKFEGSPAVQDSGTLSVSTIGGDLTITGNVTSKGEINLDGHVRGDVRCVALFLGENSSVEGNVAADDVVIRGRLIGSVRALRVTLQSTSHVEGNVFHKSLAIEEGTHFEGESCPSEDPLSSSPEGPTVEPHMNNDGSPDAAKQPGPAKGFIRSLPEWQSA
jgi:cytoskeletal protein CcmA (bactofilin family)